MSMTVLGVVLGTSVSGRKPLTGSKQQTECSPLCAANLAAIQGIPVQGQIATTAEIHHWLCLVF